MVTTIAIVGRPNVGKSTLFNRMTGKRLALVDDAPGLTRDRKEGDAEIGDFKISLLDTAGLEQSDAKSIEARMRMQTEAAIADADLILFVVDARIGVVPADEVFAELVRTSGKPVILVANKCEGQTGQSGVYEAFRLGLGDPVAISAEHAVGISDLYDAIESHLISVSQTFPNDPGKIPDDEADQQKPLRVAIVGRPNAGKSTLVNVLIGEERMITGPEAGLTRDAISVDFEWQGREIKLFDTAGLRRKSRIKERAEQLSVGDALRAIQFAEIVVILMDVENSLEKQDLQIADLVAQEGRGLVLAVNKWDVVSDKDAKIREIREEVERLLPQVKGVPVIPLSAKSGRGIDKLMSAVLKVNETWNRRLTTSELNRFLIEAVDRHTPPAVSGKRLKLRFMTQPNARPPTFVVFCSRPKDLPKAYERYLVNGLREVFDLQAVPIRLHLRKGNNPYV